MSHGRRHPLVLTLLFLLLTTVGAARTQEPVRVVGRVLSASAEPVAGAEVALQSASGIAGPVATTDAEGRFEMSTAPGDYRLVVSAVGFSPASQPLHLSGATPADVTLTLPAIVAELVSVVGQARADRSPGAVHVIDSTEMAKLKIATDDVHQMLRQMPGLNLQEEEGYGLRPNIGIRGTGSDRSSKITLMEDGVLIAPAPYAAPAAYYSPIPGRMESLEIRKGSSQIKYGPITTGGVLNYVTPSVPSNFTLGASLSGGGNSTRKATVSLGDSIQNLGWLLETFQFRNNGFKQLDGGGDTGVDLKSYMGKLRFNTTPTPAGYQEVEIKLARTEQLGDETYLGLTDADFARTPFRRYAGSQADVFDSTHTQYQARHLLARRNWDLTTVVYRHNFHRAWYKLESVLGTGISAILRAPEANAERFAVLTGADSTANALVVRNNNRTYVGAGVQSVLGLRPATGPLQHHVEVGVRVHHDEEDRFQQDDGYQMRSGRMLLTRAGTPGSQSNQVVGAQAIAGFVADTMSWRRWHVSPGIRYETIGLERRTYSATDPDRTASPATLDTDVQAVIPGIGLSYSLRPTASLFAGVHRGFAPPGPGATEGTEVEHSVNYELGTRMRRGALQTEVVGYFNDYGNLLGRDSLATGGSGGGELFNGGKAKVYGLEASATWNLSAGWAAALPLRLSYTFANAEFRNSFQSQFAPWGNVDVGDHLPYVPRHQLYASIETDHRRWRARLDAYYVGRMRTVAGQGAYVTANSTDQYAVLNLSGEYGLREGARVFLSLQNVTDAVHIVSRHPAGVRPGLPRLLQIGLRVDVTP